MPDSTGNLRKTIRDHLPTSQDVSKKSILAAATAALSLAWNWLHDQVPKLSGRGGALIGAGLGIVQYFAVGMANRWIGIPVFMAILGFQGWALVKTLAAIRETRSRVAAERESAAADRREASAQVKEAKELLALVSELSDEIQAAVDLVKQQRDRDRPALP